MAVYSVASQPGAGGRSWGGEAPSVIREKLLLSLSHCSFFLSSRSQAVDITQLPSFSPKKSLLSDASDPNMRILFGDPNLSFSW